LIRIDVGRGGLAVEQPRSANVETQVRFPPRLLWRMKSRFADAAGFQFRPPIRRSGRMSKYRDGAEIRRVYHKLAISKAYQCAMLHLANNFNLESEIVSYLRPSGLAHECLLRIELASTRPTSSMGHFGGLQRKKNHAIGCFFPNSAASRQDTAIVVMETSEISSRESQLSSLSK